MQIGIPFVYASYVYLKMVAYQNVTPVHQLEVNDLT